MDKINTRLIKILVIFIGIPLLIFGSVFFLKDHKVFEKYFDSIEVKLGFKKEKEHKVKYSKNDMKKFASYVISEHNKLYTAKTDRQFQMLIKTIYIDPDKHKTEAKEVYKLSKKHSISESLVSIESGKETHEQKEEEIVYSNNVHRNILYGSGQRFIQTSKIYVTFKKDEKDGLYKITELEFKNTKLEELKN